MSPRTCTQHNSHRRWQWSVWCNWPRHAVLSSSWPVTSSRGSKGGTKICPRRSLRHFSASNCGKNPCELNTTNAIPLPVVQREQETIPILHLGWFQLLNFIFLLWINHHFWPESLWFNTQRLLTKHELVFFTDDKPEKGKYTEKFLVATALTSSPWLLNVSQSCGKWVAVQSPGV